MQTKANPLRRNRLANLLMEASSAAIVVTNSQGSIAAVNHVAENLFGYREQDLVGESIAQLFPGDSSRDGSSHPACILSRLRDLDTTAELHFQARRKNGQVFHAKITPYPFTTASGDLCSANVIDVTRQTASAVSSANKRLIQGERLAAVLQMVSGLAHESRNALQRAQSCLDLLQLDLADQSDLMTLTDQIREALKDIQRNYEEVKSYAAPIILKRQSVDLPQLGRKIFDELTQSLDKDAPHLIIQCADACKRVKVDADRIANVLRHVLENAIHASFATSEIEFQCDWTELSDASTIEIRIRDYGEGLSEEVEQRMFEPFFTTKQHGTGLGLAVCRRIVEAHGGTIEAANAFEGGTVVLIRIPMG